MNGDETTKISAGCILIGIGQNGEQNKQKKRGTMTMSEETYNNMMKNAQAVNEAWSKVKVNADKKKTFGSLLVIIRMGNKLCCDARERMESQIKDINATYSPGISAQKTETLRNEYTELVKEHQRQLKERLDTICKAKTAEVDTIVSKTGDRDLMDLIYGLSLRSEVSDREWQAITVRVTESHDYQAMKYLSEVAEKLNRYYKPPYDPEEIISEIEKARDDLSHMISVLDKPSKDWDFKEMMILGEYADPTYNQERLERLDSEVGVAVPEKYKSLIDRLKDARDIAFKNGDNKTGNNISRFIYEKAQYVENQQIVSDYFKGEAESLIKQVIDNASGSVSQR